MNNDPKPTITLQTITEANVARLPHFKNRKGGPAHDKPDGSDWDLSTWSNALVGEVGEAANIIKKLRRGDVEMDEVYDPAKEPDVTTRQALGKEFADVLHYLSILAVQAGVDLAEAAATKWNEVSERVGYGGRLVPCLQDGPDTSAYAYEFIGPRQP